MMRALLLLATSLGVVAACGQGAASTDAPPGATGPTSAGDGDASTVTASADGGAPSTAGDADAGGIDASSSPPIAHPAWMNGSAPWQWAQIPGTTVTNDAPLGGAIAAGLLASNGAEDGFSRPKKIFQYSGASMRQSDARFFIYGSGGAGGWAGNNVWSIELARDVPTWSDWVLPSNASAVWQKGRTHSGDAYDGHSDDADYAALPWVERAYYRDGRPHSPHAYRQLQHLAKTNELVSIGRANVYFNDTGTWGVVDRVDDTKRDWERQAYPDNPFATAGDDVFVCVDSRTDDVYKGESNGIAKFSPSTKTWTMFHYDDWPQFLGPAAIDPAHDVLVRFSAYPHEGAANAKPLVRYALKDGTPTPCDLGGPAAAEVLGIYDSAARKASPMLWVPDIGAFVLFLGNGKLYKLEEDSPTSYAISVLATTGTPPPPGLADENGSANGVWTRAQYSEVLHTLVFALSTSQDFWYVRTQ